MAVLRGLPRERDHHSQRVESRPEARVPRSPTVEEVPVAQGEGRGDESDRHRDGPRPREPTVRSRGVLPQQVRRGDRGGRREQHVLERTEPDGPRLCLAAGHPGLLERFGVDEVSAGSDEDPEAGCNDRRRLRQLQLGSALDSGDFPIGDHVAGIRHELRAERHGEPHGRRTLEPVEHVVPARSPRDADRGGEGGQSRNDDEGDQRLVASPFDEAGDPHAFSTFDRYRTPYTSAPGIEGCAGALRPRKQR